MVEGEKVKHFLCSFRYCRGTLNTGTPKHKFDVEAAVQQRAAHVNRHSVGKKAQVMVEGETLLVLLLITRGHTLAALPLE